MSLLWVNERPSRGRARFHDSPLVRRAHRARLHSPAQKGLKAYRGEAIVEGAILLSRGEDEDPVNQTEDGNTFFLVTRQKDFRTKSKARPKRCIDTLGSPLTTLDTDKKFMIDWISTSWLPTTDYAQPGKFFGSFSLVWPGDGQHSTEFLRSAFQAPNERSLFTLMALTARKITLHTSNITYSANSTDYFTLKSIQALRKSIAGKEFLTDQLLLDLTLLVLAELYSKLPDSIAGLDVYWSMIRDYIVQLGGFRTIRPIIVSFIMSIDLLVSLLTVSVPKLNVWQDQRLLGLGGGSPGSEDSGYGASSDDDVAPALAMLDMRNQIQSEAVDILTQLFNAINALPLPAADSLRMYLRMNMLLALSVVTAPLCSQIPPNSSIHGYESLYTRADMVHNFARTYGIVLWWWYTAIKFIPTDSTLPIVTPPIIPLATSQAWRLVDRLRGVVKSEPWYVTSDLTFWLAATGCLVVKESSDWAEYWRILRRTAREKNIDSEAKIERALRCFLSLSIIDSNFVKTLWLLLYDNEFQDLANPGKT